jgi:hydrogenase maturation protease
VNQSQRVLIAGLGSPHGDDQAGWLVVEKLAIECQDDPDIMVRRASIPLDLLDWMEGVDVLHICDACEATESQVKLHRIEYRAETDELASQGREAADSSTVNAVNQGTNIPRSPLNLHSLRSRGTHDFGLPEVLRLAEATNLLPERVIIWAIGGKRFGPEAAIGDVCRDAVQEAANQIQREVYVGSVGSQSR